MREPKKMGCIMSRGRIIYIYISRVDGDPYYMNIIIIEYNYNQFKY